MSILVVGSVALDTIKTPFGEAQDLLGGSATYFSIAASLFDRVNLVAVIGKDLPFDKLEVLKSRNIDLKGLQVEEGKTFRWGAEYQYDLNVRQTTLLELNVFEHFDPKIPHEYVDSEYVFLANIDPDLQSNVLGQVRSPKLVVCDTINFWIEHKMDSLISLLGKVDILVLNDSEARELSTKPNLQQACKWIKEKGPQTVVIKKGEHGLLMMAEDRYFGAPAYPLEEIFDPTGAGDAFAGGFLGYLARSGSLDGKHLRCAAIYGSVLASFCVEKFGVQRLVEIDQEDLQQRFRDFKHLTHFEVVE